MFEKAFYYLILIKEKQSKLKDITYNKFETPCGRDYEQFR